LGYLSIKKAFAIVLSLALAGGISFFYFDLKEKFPKSAKEGGISKPKITARTGNGLPVSLENGRGWRELLEEIRLNIPLGDQKKPPDTPVLLYDENTLTGKLAQATAERYFELKKLSPNLPTSVINQKGFSKEIAEEITALYLANGANPYAPNSIAVIKNADVNDRRRYLNALAYVLKTNFPAGNKNNSNAAEEVPKEILIILSTLKTKQYETLSDLDPYIAHYVNAAKGFISIPVPGDYVQFHLRLSNSFANVAYALQSMQKSGSDPVTAVMGRNLYSTEINASRILMTYLKLQIEKNEFVFSAEEDGHYFYQYINKI